MYGILYKYLILNSRIAFPNLGCFFIDHIPAKIDRVTHTISAPSTKVVFDTSEMINPNHFYAYLASALQLNEIEAATQFTQFTHQLKLNALEAGVYLPGLGILKKTETGDLTFLPEIYTDTLLPDLNIHTLKEPTPIQLSESVSPMEAKVGPEMAAQTELDALPKQDYWWLWAVILMLCGLAALLYYYV